MRTIIKSLLTSSIVLGTLGAVAEPLPNFNNQQPVWNFGQTPIAWGDCVPVPVVPVPQNNFNMGAMPFPQPMMIPFPNPRVEQPILLPPPSPFYNAAPNNIPNPLPLATAPQVVCDNSELQTLQLKYNQDASASKAKIQELNQALDDANNQMADARVIIESFSQSQESNKTQSIDLNKQLAHLDNTIKTLQTKLASAELEAGAKARKITALSRSALELTALQSAYKTRNDENAALKKKLIDLDNAHKSLQAKLGTVEANAGSQARKLTVLGQSATELTALQSAYKAKNDENASLKMQLAGLTKEKLGLTARIDSLHTSSTLKGAQDSNIIAALKKKLSELDNAHKSLQAKLGTAEAHAGSQARKLTALGQSATELTALKSAYNAKNSENIELKKKLASIDGSYKSLQTKLGALETNSGAQARKITALGQSAVELVALQSAYKARNNENISLKAELASRNEAANICKFEVADLKKQLAESDNNRKSLLAKITTLETTTSNQARKITALMATSIELDGLKSAYKDLSSKKAELSTKLTADTDQDGVLDITDKCLSSPIGSEVNASGCPADADNDGIVDSKDNCPSSPKGSEVNEKGCPKIIDTDSDGIADANDLCPATAVGTTVNQFGCEPTENITLKGVNFSTGSARLTTNSYPILAAAAATLKQNPDLKIEISGYTDNQGGRAINKKLSQRRANTVMIQLIKEGVDENTLVAKGYGESNPITSNNTNEGRATNRRVELKIRK